MQDGKLTSALSQSVVMFWAGWVVLYSTQIIKQPLISVLIPKKSSFLF